MTGDEGGAAPMSREARRSRISALVLEHGTVEIDDLAAQLAVSRMTVHRDLDQLERIGVLRKVRGGATAQPSARFESDVRYRQTRQVAEKEALSEAVFGHLRAGSTVLLDEATTILPLVRRLVELPSVTVVSNFRPVIDLLMAHRHVDVLVLGGRYDRRYDTFTGPLCIRAVEQLQVDVYITSTSTICEGVASHADEQIAAVKQAMLGQARRSWLLVDHTKFGRAALFRVAPLKAFDAVWVDARLPADEQAALRAAGVSLHVVSPSRTSPPRSSGRDL
jgi:DeoR/GlpR family transcriptional regulator of sugar metabolism